MRTPNVVLRTHWHDVRPMDYVRIYTDDAGETHFEDVTPQTRQESYADAEWFISPPLPVTGMLFRRVTVEYPEEPHVAPRRQFIIGLSGEVEVEVSDGEKRRFGPASVLLVEDVTGKGHLTRRISEGDRETLFLPLAD